jgi:hypothetical protein
MSQSKDVNFKVLIDRSPEIEGLRKIIQDKDDLIKKYMAIDAERERKEIEAKMSKKAPEGGDTCRLDQEQPTKPRIVAEGSYIEPSWVKGENAEEVVSKISYLSAVAENKADFKKIESKLTKKLLNQGINIEFQGDSRLFNYSPRPIPKLCTDEQRKRIEDYNAKLRVNRQNWRNLNQSED